MNSEEWQLSFKISPILALPYFWNASKMDMNFSCIVFEADYSLLAF